MDRHYCNDVNCGVKQDTLLKRTHVLICQGCEIHEYAESIGVWDDDGNLTGAMCGECETEAELPELPEELPQ